MMYFDAIAIAVSAARIDFQSIINMCSIQLALLHVLRNHLVYVSVLQYMLI